MPTWNITIIHNQPIDKAKNLVENRLKTLLAQHGGEVNDLKMNWSDHTLDFSGKSHGISISGILHILDSKVDVQLKVPFLAVPFKGVIMGNLEKELKASLN